MPDPDPIKLTKKGNAVLLCGEVTDDVFVPLRCTAAGKLQSESASDSLSTALGAWVTQDVITVGTEPDDPTQLPNVECSEIKVVAHSGNTQPIYFGDADVNSTDIPGMLKREGEIVPRVTNANEFFVIAATGHTGQKLHLQTR